MKRSAEKSSTPAKRTTRRSPKEVLLTPNEVIARITERSLLYTKYNDHEGRMIDRLVGRRLVALKQAITDGKIVLSINGVAERDNAALDRIFSKLFAAIPERFSDAKRDLSTREIVFDAIALLAEGGVSVRAQEEAL